jgi:CheY-like chemotaxis protein
MSLQLSENKAPILLYAEDDEDTTFLVCSQFQKIAPHWKIVCAQNGMEARGLLSQHPTPDALVTDLSMPVMGGMELIEWLKAQPQFRFLPIVVYSNSGDPSDRQRCAALGVNGYLEKPGSLKELRDQIRYILKLFEEFIPSLSTEESLV